MYGRPTKAHRPITLQNMSAAEARALYRGFLRLSKHFGTSYNVKEYVKRRAREGFQEAQTVTDSIELVRLWEHGRQQLEVVRRQSIVYGLYARKHKHAMDIWTEAAQRQG